MTDIVDIDIARLRAEAEAAKASLAAMDGPTKSMVEYYFALKKLPVTVIMQRRRKMREALKWMREPELVAPKKKARKSRAAPTKTGIKRLVAAARESGLHPTGITLEGTLLFGDQPQASEPEHEVIL